MTWTWEGEMKKHLSGLSALSNRRSPPQPWEEGRTIPWDDPDFSERMLNEHLSQEHDHASRRSEIIDQHVEWIHEQLMDRQPGKILDLGCGPGFYTSRLAVRGHHCTGIDISPASIRYAKQSAKQTGLECHYIQSDLRHTHFGSECDLVMMLFGEFNVFTPSEGKEILQKSWQALKIGGRLLLEISTYESVKEIGSQLSSWYTASSGLFSPDPHIVFQECFWDSAKSVATERYYIIDLETSALSQVSSSQQAYQDNEFLDLIEECGFKQADYLSLHEIDYPGSENFVFLIAKK